MMTLNYWNAPQVENTLTLAATSTSQRGPREIADQIMQRRANSAAADRRKFRRSRRPILRSRNACRCNAVR